MHYLNHFIIFALLFAFDAEPGKDLAKDPFLRPYVEQLKQSTPAGDLTKITALAQSDLILLHHGYGTKMDSVAIARGPPRRWKKTKRAAPRSALGRSSASETS